MKKFPQRARNSKNPAKMYFRSLPFPAGFLVVAGRRFGDAFIRHQKMLLPGQNKKQLFKRVKGVNFIQ